MKTEKIEIKGSIYRYLDEWRKGEFEFSSGYSKKDFGDSLILTSDYLGARLYICDHTIVINIPVIDTIQPQLAALDAKEKELRAQLAARLIEISTARNNLLALPKEAANGD